VAAVYPRLLNDKGEKYMTKQELADNKEGYETIPEELKSFPNWLIYKLIPTKGQPKPAKVPYNPKTGKRASVTNYNDWGDINTASTAINKYAAGGIGLRP
jgi:primase-polymerase (primpol)-like protein